MKFDKERQILKEVQDRLKKSMDEDKDNREAALADLEFIAVDNAQWPEQIRADRVTESRPCITVNKMPVFIKQVVGDQRMNRPSIKVVPIDSQGDVKLAQIIGGWINHVLEVSKADIAVDHGFAHAVSCGYGALRVITKYVNDYSFDQDAFVEKVDNALAIYWGKHSKYDCSDAKYCIIITDMDRDEYREKYNREPMSFNSSDSSFVDGWCTKDTIRVAEYFVKEPKTRTIYLLDDGRVVYKLTEGDVVVRKRKVESYDIVRYLVSGDAVLERNLWAGKKYIPIIPIWGEELNVGEKRIIKGLIRDAKDSQRMYNYWSSVNTEIIALQPRSPYIATAKQISGHEKMWKNANKKNYPYLLVNHDPDAPGFPRREAPPIASSAISERIMATDQEMRDTIGLQRASLGMTSNERSGKAILERKRVGDVGTFSFIDNLSRSIEHLGRVLIDIAPKILDTDRIIRLGLDENKHDFVRINQKINRDGIEEIVNDIAHAGEYDVVVTVGPSFSTQRSEAKESMAQFIQYFPQSAPLIGDLYAKAQDWPGAEQIADRLTYLLPQEVKDKVQAEKAAENGEQPPPSEQKPIPPDEQMKLEALKLKIQENLIKVQNAELKLQSDQIAFAEQKVQLEQEKVKLAQDKAKLLQINTGGTNEIS